MKKNIKKLVVVSIILSIIAEIILTKGTSMFDNFSIPRIITITGIIAFIGLHFVVGFKKLYNFIIENRYKLAVILIITSSIVGFFESSVGLKEYIFSTDKVLSLWWNIKFYALLLVTYELFFCITNKNQYMSLIGSVVVSFSGLVQWNFNSVEALILLEFITVLVKKFFENEKIKDKIIISILIILSSIALPFTYIPYVISFGYVFLALIIWILIKNKEIILKNRNSNIIGILTIFVSTIGAIIAGFNVKFPVIESTNFYRNGISYLFNYLYNVLLPFNNIEAKEVLGSFLSIFPMPMLVSLYYLFSKEKHAEFLLPITIVTVLETMYCTSGFPEFLNRITLFSKSNILSSAPAVNFANLLIIFYFLGNIKEKIIKFKNTIRISLVVVCILIFIERPIAFISNSYLYLFVAELCLLSFLFLNYDDKKYRNVFLFFLILITLIGGVTVNSIII